MNMLIFHTYLCIYLIKNPLDRKVNTLPTPTCPNGLEYGSKQSYDPAAMSMSHAFPVTWGNVPHSAVRDA